MRFWKKFNSPAEFLFVFMCVTITTLGCLTLPLTVNILLKTKTLFYISYTILQMIPIVFGLYTFTNVFEGEEK